MKLGSCDRVRIQKGYHEVRIMGNKTLERISARAML